MGKRMQKSDLHWLTVSEAMARYSLSKNTIKSYIDKIESCGRYPDGVVLRMPRKVMVLDAALHDYIRNSFHIQNHMRIPAYNAEDMRIELMRLAI